MRLIEIGPNTTLSIPNGWTAFVYRGFVYRLDEIGRVVRWDPWKPEAKKTA